MLDTPTESPEVLPYDPVAERDKLRELTNQSWNLELVISGAALFATLGLADGLDDALTYYRYNLMPDEAYFHDMLPTLAVSSCRAACYVLFGAFLINFVMRTFWVALVGLLAVYPGGIRYDRIPKLSDYARDQYARRLGSLTDYIIRLDRRCNVVFALASMVGLVFIGLAIGYTLVVVVATMLQWLLPAAVYATFLRVAKYVLLVLFGGYYLLFTVGSLPKWRNHPRVAPLLFRLNNGLTGKSSQYIMYTFTSNVPKTLLGRRMAVFVGAFLLIEVVVLLVDIPRAKGVRLFESRSFMSLNAAGNRIDARMYDNLRPETEPADPAAIQADVIREPLVRLFIAYPKLLDEELGRRFREPVWPDSLKRKERRERQSTWRIGVLNEYFSVYVNDSLYQKPDLLFTERPGSDQPGLTTVLLPTNMKPGKNTLKLTVPDSTNKPETYCQIPFWYVPER